MAPDEYGHNDPPNARRRRSIITFALVLLLLFFAVWYALAYIRADEAKGEQANSTTTTQSANPTCDVTPQQIDVNVYNATKRDGLAARVAADLKERGFNVKTVANDPKKAKLTGAGQLRYGSNGSKGADLVRVHTGEVEMTQDARKRTNVDVVLGPKFDGLVPTADLPSC